MKNKKQQLRTPAERAYDMLLHAVQLKWYNAAPRVIGWRSTLVAAFTAHLEGDDSRSIELPANATTNNGDTFDSAGRIIEAFDAWLGRGVVAHVLEEVK